MPETVAANMKNRGHTIEVDVTVPEGPPPEGVLLAQGSALGGFSLHLWEGRPRYLHNLYGKELYSLVGDRPLEPGRHRVVFRFDRQGQGRRARRASRWTARSWPRPSSRCSPWPPSAPPGPD